MNKCQSVVSFCELMCVFFFQAKAGIGVLVRSRGLGEVYKGRGGGGGGGKRGGSAGTPDDGSGVGARAWIWSMVCTRAAWHWGPWVRWVRGWGDTRGPRRVTLGLRGEGCKRGGSDGTSAEGIGVGARARRCRMV